MWRVNVFICVALYIIGEHELGYRLHVTEQYPEQLKRIQ